MRNVFLFQTHELLSIADFRGNNVTKEILMHENFDLENVVTPINHKMLNKLLKKAKLNKTKRKFLVHGFKNGFH